MENYGFEKYINNSSLQNTDKYVVKSGDSLYSIAKKYNTTVAEIVSLNNLVTTVIYPNQILFVPKVTTSTTNYTVRSGETIRDLFQEQGIQTNLSDSILNLRLDCNQSMNNQYNNPTNTYVILQGDTLNTILSKTGLTPYELLSLNENKWIRPGEKIIIK